MTRIRHPARRVDGRAAQFCVPRFELRDRRRRARTSRAARRRRADLPRQDRGDRRLRARGRQLGQRAPALQVHRLRGRRTARADATVHELETLFEPCSKKVTLKLGYVDELQQMMTGNFTTMEPTFSASGPHTLAVRGLNQLHRMRRAKYDGQWPTEREAHRQRDRRRASTAWSIRSGSAAAGRAAHPDADRDRPQREGRASRASLRRAEERVRHRLPVAARAHPRLRRRDPQARRNGQGVPVLRTVDRRRRRRPTG